jgi:serine/threonine protein phosphatase PrpC
VRPLVRLSGVIRYVYVQWDRVASRRLQTLELVIQPTHEFLVLASDGLWEKCSCVEVVNFIRRRLFEHGDVMRAAKEMVAKVESQGSS